MPVCVHVLSFVFNMCSESVLMLQNFVDVKYSQVGDADTPSFLSMVCMVHGNAQLMRHMSHL